MLDASFLMDCQLLRRMFRAAAVEIQHAVAKGMRVYPTTFVW